MRSPSAPKLFVLAAMVLATNALTHPVLAGSTTEPKHHEPATIANSKVATPPALSHQVTVGSNEPAAPAPRSSGETDRSEPTPSIPTLALGFSLSNAMPNQATQSTSTRVVPANLAPGFPDDCKHRLQAARYLRQTDRATEATPMLIELLGDKSPDYIRKGALLELAATAEDENNFGRAQQIYAQYLQKWPDDQYVPEVLLRQGHLFREQGLNRLALTKYYAVMTSALALKHDRLDYYARLVIEAQTQIAETHFRLEKFPEAADFFARLLKLDSPFINKQDCQYKLIGSLVNSSRFEEAIAKGTDFLSRYPESPEQPEVRFHLANALKQLGRNNESMAQVLALLREQSAKARTNPQVWAYWQQRTGNVIANQLFREGDYTRALEIYLGLARLDASPAWQLPVSYQIGMTYERLWQPQKAVETYHAIVQREPELGTNATPGLKAVVDMARWRAGFVQWQSKAENFTQSFISTNTPTIASTPLLDSPKQ